MSKTLKGWVKFTSLKAKAALDWLLLFVRIALFVVENHSRGLGGVN